MAEVVWSEKALKAVQDIHAYIAADSPTAADRMKVALEEAGWRLAEFPSLGRPASRGHRELVHVRPYILRYQVTGNVVVITDVRHGARRPLK